jgi:ribosome-binding protein aMBF1 (putative translation factor)
MTHATVYCLNITASLFRLKFDPNAIFWAPDSCNICLSCAKIEHFKYTLTRAWIRACTDQHKTASFYPSSPINRQRRLAQRSKLTLVFRIYKAQISDRARLSWSLRNLSRSFGTNVRIISSIRWRTLPFQFTLYNILSPNLKPSI